MKDLIKELKNNKLDIEKHNELFASAWNSSIDNCCSVLNQHNIITAPKQIKLSKILGKLNNNEWKDFQATKQDNIISIDNNNNFRQYFNIDKGKITDISEEMQTNEYKWLYALWVAGTEIVDDLEDKE